jgi:hypothetical protein
MTNSVSVSLFPDVVDVHAAKDADYPIWVDLGAYPARCDVFLTVELASELAARLLKAAAQAS